MTIWEKIVEAQAKRSQVIFIEDGKEVHVKVEPNGWYEGYVSFS